MSQYQYSGSSYQVSMTHLLYRRCHNRIHLHHPQYVQAMDYYPAWPELLAQAQD